MAAGVGRGAGSAHAGRARARAAAQVRRRDTHCSTVSKAASGVFRRTCASGIFWNAGRAFNSSGAPQRAVPLFAEALALAERDKDEFYAVDAAHMLGIAAPAAERLGWNLKALSLAEAATDPRARGWRASLFHNIGWTYFDAGDPKTALDYWRKALVRAGGDGQRCVDPSGEVDGRARPSRRRPTRRRRSRAEEPRGRARPHAARPTAMCTRSSPRSRSRAATPRPRDPGLRKRTRR